MWVHPLHVETDDATSLIDRRRSDDADPSVEFVVEAGQDGDEIVETVTSEAASDAFGADLGALEAPHPDDAAKLALGVGIFVSIPLKVRKGRPVGLRFAAQRRPGQQLVDEGLVAGLRPPLPVGKVPGVGDQPGCESFPSDATASTRFAR